MADDSANIPRLNGIIRALEDGRQAFGVFSPGNSIDTAIELGASDYDFVLIDMEHKPWNPDQLSAYLQFMMDRGQIVKSGSIAPKVTPIVRVPVNGKEMGQGHAKQALDLGAYGIMFPHITTEEEAYNAIAACRYPTLESNPLHKPSGIRGDGPKAAARYWGLPAQEYYQKADVWPLNPKGEVLAILQIEDLKGVKNLDGILSNVPGIGAIMIGEGDLGQELGKPRDYNYQPLLEQMAIVREVCKRHNVVVGHPHVEAGNATRVVEEGYRMLMCATTTNYKHLTSAKEAAGLLKR